MRFAARVDSFVCYSGRWNHQTVVKEGRRSRMSFWNLRKFCRQRDGVEVFWDSFPGLTKLRDVLRTAENPENANVCKEFIQQDCACQEIYKILGKGRQEQSQLEVNTDELNI